MRPAGPLPRRIHVTGSSCLGVHHLSIDAEPKVTLVSREGCCLMRLASGHLADCVYLAAAGAMEIKAHPWFAGVDWAALERRAVRPPHNPGRRASLDAGTPRSSGADRTDRDMIPGCSPVDTSDPVTAAILARLDTFFGEEKWREEGSREKEAAARMRAAQLLEEEARRREEEEMQTVMPRDVRIL